jgi:hypothetical protein
MAQMRSSIGPIRGLFGKILCMLTSLGPITNILCGALSSTQYMAFGSLATLMKCFIISRLLRYGELPAFSVALHLLARAAVFGGSWSWPWQG